ncbi:MAG: hypothetical protein RL685_6020 [Pseudomonadota bacterium]|jgi:hypothetical protein
MALSSACAESGRVVRNAEELGTLDANRDGLLTDEDLRPGEAAVHLTHRAAAGEGGDAGARPVRHVTSDAFIYYDENALMCPPGWGLKVPVQTPELARDVALFFWFRDTTPELLEMAAGQAEAFTVSVDIPEIEHGGRDDGPYLEPVTITGSTGSTSSGWFEGGAQVGVAFYDSNPVASGESFQIHGVAFNTVRTEVPEQEGECREDRGTPAGPPDVSGPTLTPN